MIKHVTCANLLRLMSWNDFYIPCDVIELYKLQLWAQLTHWASSVSEGYKGCQHPKSKIASGMMGKPQGFKKWLRSQRIHSSAFAPLSVMETRMCAGAVWGWGVAVLGVRAARWADVAGLKCFYTGVIPLYLLLSCSLCRDAHFPLMLLVWPRGLITLRLISLRHTWSISENRLQLLWKRFLDLLRIFK